VPVSHPVLAQIVREALEANNLLDHLKPIQYATQMVASDGQNRGFILVFTTGSIVVQGQPSPLSAWLWKLKDHVETGKELPRYERPQRSPLMNSPNANATRPPHEAEPAAGPTGTSVRPPLVPKEPQVPWYTTWQPPTANPR